eukprot:1161189-Pelagomonas_calceolata.AAC.1
MEIAHGTPSTIQTPCLGSKARLTSEGAIKGQNHAATNMLLLLLLLEVRFFMLTCLCVLSFKHMPTLMDMTCMHGPRFAATAVNSSTIAFPVCIRVNNRLQASLCFTQQAVLELTRGIRNQQQGLIR